MGSILATQHSGSQIQRFALYCLCAMTSVLLACIADDIPLWFSTGLLMAVIVGSIFTTVRYSTDSTARILSLPDIAFITGAFIYFVHPALASLYSGYEPARTMVLQQLMVVGLLSSFFAMRLRSNWVRWRTLTRTVRFDPSTENARILFFLLIVLLPWVLLAFTRLSEIVTVEYGERSPGQRNANTIPLLGLDYFCYIVTALAACGIRQARHRLAWVMALFPLGFGVLQFLVTSTRTAVLFGGLLSVSLGLLRLKSTKWLPWVMLSAFFILLPLFDVIGRVRYDLPSWDMQRITALATETFQLSYGEMVENNEAVTMSQHADIIIDNFSSPPLLGYYIFFCVIQSPPAMILKYFGLEDIRALSAEYVRAFYPGLYEAGGSYALSISAEAYCNFNILGGVILGILAALFYGFLERFVCRLCCPPLAYVILCAYSINLAKLHRNGVEMMPKPILVIGILCLLYAMFDSVVRFLQKRTQARSSSVRTVMLERS